MAEKSIEALDFENLLSDYLSKVFHLKDDLNYTIESIKKIISSAALSSSEKESKNKIEIFNQTSTLSYERLEEIENSIRNILSTLQNTKNSFSNITLTKEKNELLKSIDMYFIIYSTFKNSAITLEQDFNSYSRSSSINNNAELKKKILNNLNSTIKLLSELSQTSNQIVSLSHFYNFNLLDISKKIQFETDRNFTKRFDEEKNIILKDFNIKLNQITSNYELKHKDFKSDLSDFKNKIINLNNELEKNNLKNQDLTKNLNNFNDILKEIIESKHLKIEDQLQIVFKKLTQEFNSKLEEMNIEFDKAKKAKLKFVQLVENAGIYNLTENYNNKAIEEKNEYKRFRDYTSKALYAAIGCTIIILGIPLIEYWGAPPPNETNYYTILVRLSISLMFFVLALYFSKQAAKHYECYQENHKTFLQLAALEPFMAKMDSKDQLDIRKQLIPIYFSQDSERRYASKSDEVSLPESFQSTIEKLTDAVKDIKINQNNKP